MNSATGDISPETLALVEAQAREMGMSPDEYIRRLLPPEQELALRAEPADEEFENDLIAFAEGTENSAYRPDNYTREDIYFDHD